MKHFEYAPSPMVCTKKIAFDLDEENRIHNLVFTGGCNGNLQGISALVKGMTAQDAITRLKGIRCGFKTTSCPDQLAQALEGILANN